jgi:hypothetical protein
VGLYIPLTLQGNGLVNMFPRQPKIVGGVVFYESVSYKRKVGDKFSPELLVKISDYLYCNVV